MFRNIFDFLDGLDVYFFYCELKEIWVGKNYKVKVLD